MALMIKTQYIERTFSAGAWAMARHDDDFGDAAPAGADDIPSSVTESLTASGDKKGKPPVDER